MSIIHTAVVLHNGWDMDNVVWVHEDKHGKRKLMSTCHGDECSMEISELDEKITETENSLRQLTEAKRLITERK